ncbi:MAG: FHA domain-containing protein [Lewinellaceae bacterium]|nr:FHA domain-containing protein [Saprospiraceae bacterium]MCB9313083.1 FHA domain-containing protein [Lewinellaceae bacterium]
MTRDTVQLSGGNSLKQTMVQGFRAMSGKDVPNFTILFLDPTRNKLKGDFMNVVVPYVEIGRSSKCAIRYGEDYPTVSRVHAALQSINGQVVIKHLGTNPTLVNGQPVQDSMVLNNGDEVQLSYEGPRIRINTSAVKTSTMKFTQRMALYTSQALVPYKKALAILGSLLILAVAGFGYANWQQKQTIDLQGMTIEEQQSRIADLDSKQNMNDQKANQLRGQLASNRQYTAQQRSEMEAELRRLEEDNRMIASELQMLAANAEAEKSKMSGAQFLKDHEGDIYFVFATEMTIIPPGGQPQVVTEGLWTGTGFITSEGNFVTARHVIKPWKYNDPSDPNVLDYNAFEMSGGQIVVKFKAYSPSGDKFDFTSNEMKSSDAKDEAFDNNGKAVKISQTSETDWAYMPINDRRGSLVPDRKLASQLNPGDVVHVAGYQYSYYTQDLEKGISPNYSSTQVAQSGLRQGVIQTSNRGFGQGSSGAPAIVEVDGEFKLVGIAVAGVGSEQGLIVPIGNLR